MTTEHDNVALLVTEHGLGPFWNRCLLCGTDLELDWPDLTELNPSDIKNHAPDEWRRAAARGCPFCNVIMAVLGDAMEEHECSVPNFYHKLLFTGSPTGNDSKGFQVILARNESTGRYLLALELIWMPFLEPGPDKEYWGTITIYLDGPDVFHLSLEPFFEIPRHSGSDAALRYGQDWLKTCQNDHPDCSLASKGDEDPAPSSDPCGTLPQYVALSHCWGSSQTLRTMSTNIKKFQTGIEIRDLPSTFKDAVNMTKSLGFDYIWIDSLCILQDSLTDWEEQSSLMAFVYGNAELVLAASSASSTEDGFLKERKGHRESSIRLSSGQNQDSTLALRYRLLEWKDEKPLCDPLDRRAWALQERLLARRYLAMGSHDTTWTCATSLACECEWWRVASMWRGEIPNIKRVLRDTTNEKVLSCWREQALRHYGGRHITVPSDNLVAVSAIASVLQENLGQEYYAGIWQGDLIPGLLWNASDPRYPNYAMDNSAPSWSWASLPLLNFGTHSNISALSENRALVEVLETKTTPSTMNAFGSVHSGFIKFCGQLWEAEVAASDLLTSISEGRDPLMKVDGYFQNTLRSYFDMSLILVDVCLPGGARERSMRRVRHEEVQDGFYIGNTQDCETVHLLMAPLLEEMTESNSSKLTRIHGLILGRSCKHPEKFERLGCFFVDNSATLQSRAQNENSKDDFGEQEIVII